MQESVRNLAKGNPPLMCSWINQVARTVAILFEQYPDGFTYDPRRACLASFPRGRCLTSLGGFEVTFLSTPTRVEVRSWVENAASILLREETYIGGWFSKGAYYLDVSIAFQGKEISELVGRVNQQDAIFEWESQTEITL